MSELTGVVDHVDKKVNKVFPGRSIDIPEQIDVVFEWIPIIYVLLKNIIFEKNKKELKNLLNITGSAYILLSILLTVLKSNINRRRPGSLIDFKSFPSRHSTTAFYGAHILCLRSNCTKTEKVLGYGVASFTGALRIRRRKHWLSDVIAGAMIGITAVHVTHYLYEKVNKK